MIDGQNYFDKPVKNDFRANDNIQKIATVQGDELVVYQIIPISKNNIR